MLEDYLHILWPAFAGLGICVVFLLFFMMRSMDDDLSVANATLPWGVELRFREPAPMTRDRDEALRNRAGKAGGGGPYYTRHNMPEGYKKRKLQANQWAVVKIHKGRLKYQVFQPFQETIVVNEQCVIEPKLLHGIVPYENEDVEFYIEYYTDDFDSAIYQSKRT